MPKKAKAINASGANEPSKWRSKIVGHEKVQAGQLMANPFNHRRHPEKQRKVVAASIEELGFIKSVIVNKVTGHIVDGHERVMQALGVGEETLVDVEYVELSQEDEKKALLVLDATSELAEVDASSLDQLIKDCAFDMGVLDDLAKEMLADCGLSTEDEGNPYTKKIEAPVYTPKGLKPKVSELCNTDKTNELVKEIASAELPKEVKTFLTLAAQRHNVFHFGKIAEFYCHADKPTQELFERSGLIIIDMDAAIQNGFVYLTEKLGRLCDLQGDSNEDA